MNDMIKIAQQKKYAQQKSIKKFRNTIYHILKKKKFFLNNISKQ